MSELVKVIDTEAAFAEATQSGIVLVDFFATWCGPCRMQSPILDQVASAVAGKAAIIKVDTDKIPTLAQKYDVSSIPTLVLLKNGQVVSKMIGLQQASVLQESIEKA
jgi:thioredoxin 1